MNNKDQRQTNPPPVWLPNWQHADEYTHLSTTIEYECESIEIATTDPETGEIITRRGIKPGTLKGTKSDTPKKAFAWEFLRRNPDYQADYQRIVTLAKLHGATDHYTSGTTVSITRSMLLPGADDETPYPAFHAELYRTLSKWGLAAWLLNPGRDLHDAPPLNALWRMGNDSFPAVRIFYDNGEPIPLSGGIIPTDNETFLLFDISRPLARQIDKMKEHLETQQKLRNNGKLIRASNTENRLFTNYLRILDADARGADDTAIIEALYSDSNETRYSAKAQTNPARNFLKNHRKAAYALRDKDYQLLLD